MYSAFIKSLSICASKGSSELLSFSIKSFLEDILTEIFNIDNNSLIEKLLLL